MEIAGPGVAVRAGTDTWLGRPLVEAEYWRVRDLQREKHHKSSEHKSQRPHHGNLARWRRGFIFVNPSREPLGPFGHLGRK